MITFMGNTHTQVFSVRFSNDDKLLATGTIDGDVNLYETIESKTIGLGKSWRKESLPTTGIRWKPKVGDKDFNIFVTTCADGSLTWFNKTGEMVHREGMTHALLCCDYSQDSIVVGRDDFGLSIFDDNIQKEKQVQHIIRLVV